MKKERVDMYDGSTSSEENKQVMEQFCKLTAMPSESCELMQVLMAQMKTSSGGDEMMYQHLMDLMRSSVVHAPDNSQATP